MKKNIRFKCGQNHHYCVIKKYHNQNEVKLYKALSFSGECLLALCNYEYSLWKCGRILNWFKILPKDTDIKCRKNKIL